MRTQSILSRCNNRIPNKFFRRTCRLGTNIRICKPNSYSNRCCLGCICHNLKRRFCKPIPSSRCKQLYNRRCRPQPCRPYRCRSRLRRTGRTQHCIYLRFYSISLQCNRCFWCRQALRMCQCRQSNIRRDKILAFPVRPPRNRIQPYRDSCIAFPVCSIVR